MKKLFLFILLAVVFLPHNQLMAQNAYDGQIKFEQSTSKKEGQEVLVTILLDLSDLTLKKQQMIKLTPKIVSFDTKTTYAFEPLLLMGGTRKKVVERALLLGDLTFDQTPISMTKRYNKHDQSIELNLVLPFQEWLREAELVFEEEVTGCANCDLGKAKHNVLNPILPQRFVPQYLLSYVTPPVEPVKQRSEMYAAFLNFQVGRYELLRNFKNNAAILEEVDGFVNKIRKDPDLTITSFKISGYASPEGNFNSNMKLSANRVNSILAYLKDQHGLNQSMIVTEAQGEDWAGLRKVVEASHIQDRDKILNIIDNTPDIALRKRQIQSLSGGSTYKMLLQDFYPPLRRIEYTIAFVARPFDVNEAKLLIKTKPQYLSLNEMFLVANTYPRNSQEFKEVFDIAVRLFPDNPVSSLNAGALEIETGALDKAIERLLNIDMPESHNNLGIAYFLKQDYTKAAYYLKKAADAGNENAKNNLEQYEKWSED